MSQSAQTCAEAGTPPPNRRSKSIDRIEVGRKIGRYPILGELGRGGMGVVYWAYDEELDRKLAIKLLRKIGSTATRRLRREAQAMAQLSHPNVAQVYEVGTHEGELYVAMEYIDGPTLAQWVRRKRPSAAQIMAVMDQAGRGLHAAHEAGLVHRDFKPDNVIIASDGRVRVLDFGLVGFEGESIESNVNLPIEVPTEESLDMRITVTGALLGTPAYMSPEQFHRDRPGPKSDQWSFCVTLYEALYGERPFAGTEQRELADSVTDGDVRPAPPYPSVKVPRWLREVLLRGMALDPENRFADMDELLTALRRNPTRRRRLLALGAVTMALGVGALGWHRADLSAQRDACDEAASAITEDWSKADHDAVRVAMLDTSRPYAAATLDRAERAMDDYAAAWSEGRRATCLAATVEGALDSEDYARANACHAVRRAELGALVAALSEGRATAVDAAIAWTRALPELESCRDSDLLRGLPELPEEAPERVRQLRQRLLAASAELDAGEIERSRFDADPVARAAGRLGYAPLDLSAQLVLGELADAAGDLEGANTQLEHAYFGATEAGVEPVAVDAALQLARVALRRAKREEQKDWLRRAAMWAERMELGSTDPRWLELRMGEGVYARLSGDHEGAAEALDEALRGMERALGPDHPWVASALAETAGLHADVGEHDEAIELIQRATAITMRAFPPEHPAVVCRITDQGHIELNRGHVKEAGELFDRALKLRSEATTVDKVELAAAFDALATVRYKESNYEEAERLFRRALALREQVLANDHPDLIETLSNLGTLHYKAGDFAAAERAFERTLTARISAVGPDAPEVAASYELIGVLRWRLHRPERAEEAFAKALEINRKAWGPDHPQVAESIKNLASLHLEAGDSARAGREYQQALDILRGSVEPGDERIIDVLNMLALVAIKEERWQDCADLASRAVALASVGETSKEMLAGARYSLARGLYGIGEDRPHALQLAQQAYGEVVAVNPTDMLAWEIQHWLDQRGVKVEPPTP